LEITINIFYQTNFEVGVLFLLRACVFYLMMVRSNGTTETCCRKVSKCKRGVTMLCLYGYKRLRLTITAG